MRRGSGHLQRLHVASSRRRARALSQSLPPLAVFAVGLAASVFLISLCVPVLSRVIVGLLSVCASCLS